MARHHSTDKPQAPHLRARLGHYFVVDLDGLAIIATHRDPARMLDELLGNPPRPRT